MIALHRRHFPAEPRHSLQYENGERATCPCGQAIVYVKGYEKRRDTWRAIGGKK